MAAQKVRRCMFCGVLWREDDAANENQKKMELAEVKQELQTSIKEVTTFFKAYEKRKKDQSLGGTFRKTSNRTLPWRMLTYEFNTIDDLFAFVIKMPTLYRITFLIYLYQRWAYRVVPTRMNEYGTSGKHEHGVPPPVEGAVAATTKLLLSRNLKKDK